MTIPTIDPLPDAPNPLTDSQPGYNAKALALTQAMPTFITQVNSTGAAMDAAKTAAESAATTATTKAGEASSSAGTATTKAGEAAASAATALSAPGTSATSTTSLTVGTGSKSLTIQTGKSIVVGMSVAIAYTTTPTNRMVGTVTAYDSGTGALTVSVTYVEGSGTYAAWTVSLTAAADLSGLARLGTANNYTAAQNHARATVASAATTADIWGAAGNQIDWTGTVTCTGFPAAPQAGAERVLITAGAAPFTAGANMLIDGVTSGNTYTCAAGDTVTVRAITVSQFKLTIQKKDGTAVVGGAAASQAEMEAGSSESVFTTPGRQQYHPSAAKAWIKCDAAGNINASYNVASITDTAVGRVTVTLDVDMSSSNYAISCGTNYGGSIYLEYAAQAAGSFEIKTRDSSGAAIDATSYSAICFGDL